MKWFMTLAVAAAMVVCGSPALGDGVPAGAKKEILCHVRICKGDPLGSREAGTVKVCQQPKLVTRENQPATFISGGEMPVKDGDAAIFVPFGTSVFLKPGSIKDGKIRLDVNVSITTADALADRAQFHTESTRSISTVRLGDVLKIRCGRGTADSQTWIELTVEEVHPVVHK